MAIPITKPLFGPEEFAAVQVPLKTGWVVQGPFVAEFEKSIQAFTGTPFAVATSSCTTALHIAVASLGLKPGDEVIVPAFTWVATANVVEYMGARPVFCDIDLATFNIDVKKIEPLITSRTIGIIPVHLFGLSADMPAILTIARAHGLWVVEDAACGLGARIGGQHAGTFGDVGCLSFHPRKAITTGEGGAIMTARGSVDTLARTLRDHGASRSDLDRHTGSAGFLLPNYAHLGYNFRMTDIQAAVGCEQFKRACWIFEQRERLAALYGSMLGKLEAIELPVVPPGYSHGYQSYVCLFGTRNRSCSNVQLANARRNEVMRVLEGEGIATRQGTHAAALQPFYTNRYGLRAEQFPNSFLADRLSLALPLFPQMTDDELSTVCDAMTRACAAST